MNLRPPGYELLSSCQTLAVQCFWVLFVPDFGVTRRSKSLFRPLCPCAHFVVWVSVWVENYAFAVSGEGVALAVIENRDNHSTEAGCREERSIFMKIVQSRLRHQEGA